MNPDPTDRTSADLLLFALGFTGFLTGAAGAALASVVLALFGGALLLFVIACFGFRALNSDS